MKTLFASICPLLFLKFNLIGQGLPPYVRNPMSTNPAVSVPLNLEYPRWNGVAWDFVTISASGGATTNLIQSLTSTNGYFIYTVTANGNTNALFVMTNAAGDGSSLSNLNASNLGSGKVPDARLNTDINLTNVNIYSSGAARSALRVFPATGSSSNVVSFLAGTNGSSGLKVLDTGVATNNGALGVSGVVFAPVTSASALIVGSGNAAYTFDTSGTFGGGISFAALRGIAGYFDSSANVSGAGGGTGGGGKGGAIFVNGTTLGFMVSSTLAVSTNFSTDSYFVGRGIFAVGVVTVRSNSLPPTSITFPASTATWTNTAANTASPAVNITLYVDTAGVTGTVLAQNGTTICSTLVAGSMFTLNLNPGDYFSLTYTLGSPTGKWHPR